MRTTLLLAVFFICLSADTAIENELQNTTWKGTFNIPEPTEGFFVFKQDTVTVMVNDYALETMQFSTKGDTLSLTKISGDSSCGSDEGLYKYSVNGSSLKLQVLSDDCPDRSSGISTKKYVKQ